MEIWWLAPLYVVLLLVGQQRKMQMEWLFAFLNGIFLAQYSFFFLPQIFAWDLPLATIWVLLGILVGSAAEDRLPYGCIRFLSPILFFACIMLYDGISFDFGHGVLGGMGLYYAASALLPDVQWKKENFGTAFGGIVGFLLGTLILFYI